MYSCCAMLSWSKTFSREVAILKMAVPMAYYRRMLRYHVEFDIIELVVALTANEMYKSTRDA